MRVPLLCNISNDKLEIVRNGTVESAPLPLKPFILMPTMFTSPIKRVAIGSTEQVCVSEKYYNTIDEYSKVHFSSDVDKLSYIELIYTELPDYFYSYDGSDPKIMVVDIEVLTKGTGVFPRPLESPIVAIGYKIVGSNCAPSILAIDKTELDNKYADMGIIIDFITAIVDNNPDIIATFNGIKFDMMYLMQRMTVVGLSNETMSRNLAPCTPDDIPLRIHWDMWRDVDKDQTLHGLPNRRLKTIARHFGWSDVIDLGRDVMSNTMSVVGTSAMVEYLSSDVILTEKLANVYIDNHVALAEMVGMPLREEMNAMASLIPKIYHIRNLRKKYIATNNNETRYRSILGTMRYESAKVGIYDSGTQVDKLMRRYDKIYKIDFSSQYPSAMYTFNLGPDTTRLVETRPYRNVYVFKNTGKTLWLNVPDKNANKQIIVSVDMTRSGFLRELLSSLRDTRKSIKGMMKDDPDNKGLYSRQWAIKVVMNSIYGYNGLATASWGDLSVAIGTVSICRWLIEAVEKYLGNSVVETDSVSNYTEIVAYKDGYGKFYPTMEELLPTYYEPTPGGSSRRYYVPDLMVLTRRGMRRAYYVKAHYTNKHMYRVRIKNSSLVNNECSSEVDVTSDHSLYRYDGSKVSPTDIITGDKLQGIRSDGTICSSIVESVYDVGSIDIPVYDISTEDGTFIAARSGLVVSNTDGIHINKEVNVDDINNYLSELIYSTFGVEGHMELELEEYGSGYFYRAKNYLLEKPDGTIKRVGAVFKSSRHSRIYERAMSILVPPLLRGDSNMWKYIKDARDMTGCALTDFIMSTSIKQDPDEYTNPDTLQPTLARKAKVLLDMDVGEGDSIDYIVTTGGAYTIASQVDSIDRIDMGYYSKEIDKLISVLGLSGTEQLMLC